MKKQTLRNNSIAKIRQRVALGLGILNLKKAQQEKVIEGLMDTVAARINIAIWNNFSEPQKSELKKLLEKASKEKVMAYLASEIENFPLMAENITRKTVDDFKKRRDMMMG